MQETLDWPINDTLDSLDENHGEPVEELEVEDVKESVRVLEISILATKPGSEAKPLEMYDKFLTTDALVRSCRFLFVKIRRGMRCQ